MNECAECQDGKKLIPIKSLGSLTTYKQWGDVVVPHNSKTNDDGGKDSYKKLSMIIKEVSVEEVLDEFQQQFKNTVRHINVKRIQSNEFQNDLKNPDIRVLQIDYAMAYQCENQKEVMGALWARGSVNLFTCALYHQGSTKTMLDYKGKDKWANGTFIEDIYEHFPTTDDIRVEVIWSDGPVPEFKNQFMRQLLEILSLKYNKPFTWKFSATSHGKGVVDGVGGKVKSSVRRNVMSLKEDRLVVQDAADFAKLATKLTTKTTVKYVPVSKIEDYKSNNPFKSSKSVNGISQMHVFAVDGNKTQMWTNSALQNSGEIPDISFETNANTSQSQPLDQTKHTKLLSYHDIVKIISGPYIGYYALVTDKQLNKLDDEIEINYLKLSSGNKLMMVPHDLDSRPITALQKVDAIVDGSTQYFVAYLDE